MPMETKEAKAVSKGAKLAAIEEAAPAVCEQVRLEARYV